MIHLRHPDKNLKSFSLCENKIGYGDLLPFPTFHRGINFDNYVHLCKNCLSAIKLLYAAEMNKPKPDKEIYNELWNKIFVALKDEKIPVNESEIEFVKSWIRTDEFQCFDFYVLLTDSYKEVKKYRRY